MNHGLGTCISKGCEHQCWQIQAVLLMRKASGRRYCKVLSWAGSGSKCLVKSPGLLRRGVEASTCQWLIQAILASPETE